jgi:phosphotransferase system, enzyme I, PtsP
MPLIHDHRILGVLAAWKATSPFGRDEVTFFVTIAAPLAAIIDEHAAADEVASLLNGGMQETAHVQGVMAAGGLAIGTAALLDPLATLEPVPDRRVDDIVWEEKVFRAAVAAAQAEVRTSSERMAGAIPSEVREIFDVYVMLLGSDELVQGTVERIRGGELGAGCAPRHHCGSRTAIRPHGRPLRARGEDVRQIGQRILVHLHSHIQPERSYPERCILVGDTISITEIAAVPVSHLAGIVCRHRSTLSHMAVLARALEIPAVVSLSSLPRACWRAARSSSTVTRVGSTSSRRAPPTMRSSGALQSARQPPNGSKPYGTCRLKHWMGSGCRCTPTSD